MHPSLLIAFTHHDALQFCEEAPIIYLIIYDEVSFDFPFRRMRRIALHHAASRTLECVYSILLTFHRFKDGVGVGAFVASLLKRSRTEQRK